MLLGNANFGPHMAAGPAVGPRGTKLRRCRAPGGRAWAHFSSASCWWSAFGPLAGQGLDQEVRYSARDSIRYDLSLQTVYLFGGATVKYGDITLTADRLAYDLKNECAPLVRRTACGHRGGKPVFTEGSYTIESDSIRYNHDRRR